MIPRDPTLRLIVTKNDEELGGRGHICQAVDGGVDSGLGDDVAGEADEAAAVHPVGGELGQDPGARAAAGAHDPRLLVPRRGVAPAWRPRGATIPHEGGTEGRGSVAIVHPGASW
jgi:hypothetical protein